MNAAPGPVSPVRRAAPLWMVLLGGVALAFMAFLIARQQESLRGKSEFVRRAEVYSAAMQASLAQHLESLRGLQRLLQLSSRADSGEFQTWAREILAERPELQVLEWCPRVSGADRARFEAEAGRNRPVPFTIVERDARRQLRPAAPRSEYFPVLHFAPVEGNEPVNGFDVATGLASHELWQARDTGQAATSERLRLVQDVRGRFGLIVTLPVYQAGPVPDSVAQRREAFAGCVRGVFRMNELFQSAWREVPFTGVETLVVDGAALQPTNRFILFNHSTDDLSANPATEQNFREGHHHEARLLVGGRIWTILFRPTVGWWQSQFSWLPHFILAGGLSITLLIAGYLRGSLRRTELIECTVVERTAELQRANDWLKLEVAERRRTEAELSKAQATLMRAQRIGRVGSWEVDLDTGALSWSEETCRIFGHDPETFQPTHAAFYAAIHPDDRARVEAAGRAAREHQARYDTEHRVRRPDGSEHIVHEMAEVVRDEQGQARRLIGTVQDITERHCAEERLEMERNLLRTVIDHLPDYISFKDREGRFVMLNQACQQLLGVPQMEEAIGRTDADFLPAEVAMTCLATDARITNSGQPVINHEEPLLTRDGQKRVLLTTKIPLRDARGLVTGIVGVSRDITELKHAEEARHQLARKFQETQKLESLGVLAGGIAHDFNNLLTGILGHAGLARLRLAPDSELQPHLEQIENSSLRAADLCKQMLAYSGKGRFVIQRLQLSQLVQDTVQLLQISINKKAVLDLQLEGPLPVVMGDATQFRQVIMNLVLNASDALGDKRGTISLSTCAVLLNRATLAEYTGGEELMPGPYVVLEVTDSGCGMNAATLARIFEPFFTTKFTGRGLGLAAVLGIVRGHKGALQVRSQPGLGTTFRLVLPAAGPASRESNLTARPTPPVGRGHGPVLVIDDEEGVRLVASQMLKSLGFDVLTAADGEQGVQLFRAHQDKLRAVLCDLTMPKKDGEETIREIRALDPKTCVVLMSGFNEQETAARFVSAGLAGFLQKPFTTDQLRERLARLLGPGRKLKPVVPTVLSRVEA